MKVLMIQELSILIPTRNDICLNQVRDLHQMASDIGGLHFEIIVSDDASIDENSLRQNAKINEMAHCSLIRHDKNLGRAANRNFLARQARYEWLLFLDCNVGFPDKDFIKNYLSADEAQVVNGGITIINDKPLSIHNLRYKYEQKIAPQHTAQQRQTHPYQSFRTTNFIARREVMLAHPFDETIAKYGYEDVIFGKRLCDAKISIQHIDNPVVMMQFESNEKYISKLEDAMHTLHEMQNELTEYSPLLSTAKVIKKMGLLSFARFVFKKKAKRLRQNLTGNKPKIRWLNAYKLGYFLSIK